jgi:hypothetical protein
VLRSHLGVLADMLRCAPCSLEFRLATYCLSDGDSTASASGEEALAAAERVIGACAAPLLAALPRMENTSAAAELRLEAMLQLPWVLRLRRGDAAGAAAHEAHAAAALRAAFLAAVGVSALSRLVASLRSDAFFSPPARTPALRLLCTLAAHDGGARAALLHAGLPDALVATLRRYDGALSVAPLLRRLVKTYAPLAEAAFAAGAAGALAAALHTACEQAASLYGLRDDRHATADDGADAAVRALKSAARAGFAPQLRAAGALAPLVACFATRGERGLERAIAAIHAVLSPTDDDDALAQLRDHAVAAHVAAEPGALAALMRGAARPPAPSPSRDAVTDRLSWCAWLLSALMRGEDAPALLSTALLDAAQPLAHLPAMLSRGGRVRTLAMQFIAASGTIRPSLWALLAAPPAARAAPAALATLALAEASAALHRHDDRFLRLLVEGGGGERVAMCVHAGLSAFARWGDYALPARIRCMRESAGAARAWRDQARGGGGGGGGGDGADTAGVLRRLLLLTEEPLSDETRVARLVARAVAAAVAAGGAPPALTQHAAAALAAAADTRRSTQDAEEQAQYRPHAPPPALTLQQTLCAGAAAGCGPLVAAAAAAELLRRIAANEPVGDALKECCFFLPEEEGRCACCDGRRAWPPARFRRGAAEGDGDDVPPPPPRLSEAERVDFEEALVAAFQERLRERLSWERRRA